MPEQLVAHVAVDKVALHFDKDYSYSVPETLRGAIQVGARVLVPFGGGNRRRQGLVLSLCEEHCESPLKPVAELVDEAPLITAELLELVSFLKRQTLCTWYEAARLVLPTGLNMQISSEYSVSADYLAAGKQLNGEEQERIVSFLLTKRGAVSEKALLSGTGVSPRSTALKNLISDGVVIKSEHAKRKTKDERITMARLTQDAQTDKATPKQAAVIELLLSCGSASIKEIGYYAGASKATLDAMLKRGILEYFEREVLRTPYDGVQKELSRPPALSKNQQEVYEGIATLMQAGQPETALLFGITGSGKTHVFLRLIADVLKSGRQVIMLVPEISLTPQMLARFYAVFGDKVAVLHSALSLGERLDEYKRIRSGKVSIAVGTRSAVFAPFENLGLIIMDEEQEHTYKSEGAPRYHTRDVARFRCKQHGALLLLASATPDVESYYHAQAGHYRLFELNERFGSAGLPQVVVVNMSDEAIRGNTGSISVPLAQEIAQNLQNGEQSILFLNRRGFHTLIACADCGEVIICKNCSIAMTYHKANDKLMCHYCGYLHTPEASCVHCGSEHIKYLGLGTQKVEDELALLFPSARILRMDADTTMARYSYDDYFARFARGEYDILVGTQMVAKGLDFENVSLVGVLSADKMLYTADFRGTERAFSLLTQVVGRSGRGSKLGRAYIQTYTPEHEVIALAAQQDYPGFYEGEILCRKNLLYPPYCSFCIAGFSGESESVTLRGAQEFLRLMQELVKQSYPDLPLKVLGPVPSAMLKVSGRYRYRLIIKCRADAKTRRMLHEALCAYSALPVARSAALFIDIGFDGIV